MSFEFIDHTLRVFDLSACIAYVFASGVVFTEITSLGLVFMCVWAEISRIGHACIPVDVG